MSFLEGTLNNRSPLAFHSLAIMAGVLLGLFAAKSGPDAVLLFLGLAAVFMAVFSTRTGLFLIIAIYPVAVGFTNGVGPGELIFSGLFVMWYLGWLARLLAGSHDPVVRHPMTPPALALALLLAVSAVNGLARGALLMDVFRDVTLYVGFLVVFPVASVIRDRRSAINIVKILALIGVPFFVWSSYVWYMTKFMPHVAEVPIAEIGEAYLGPAIGMLWPLVLIKTSNRARVFGGLGLLAFLAYAGLSGYRHKIVFAVVMTLAAMWGSWSLQKGGRKFSAAVPVFAGLAFALFIVSAVYGGLHVPGADIIRDRYATLLSPRLLANDPSAGSRMLTTDAALSIFKKSPVVGRGAGHWMEMFGWDNKWKVSPLRLDVGYAELLMKFGLIGFAVFAWYFWAFIRMAYRSARNADDNTVKVISLGAIIWVVSSLAIATVSSPFSDRGFNFVLGVMAGILPVLPVVSLKQGNPKTR